MTSVMKMTSSVVICVLVEPLVELTRDFPMSSGSSLPTEVYSSDS